MNQKQLFLLVGGAILLTMELFFVPIKIFHHAGDFLVLVEEGLRYEWLPGIPPNSRIQAGLLAAELCFTLILMAVGYWALWKFDGLKQADIETSQ